MNGYINDRRHVFVASNKNLYILFLQIYFICLPLNSITLGAVGSILKYIAILPVGISLLSMKVLRFNSTILAQISFVLIAALSCLWSIDSSMSFDRTVSYVLLTALMFSATTFNFDDNDLRKIKKAFLWSSRSTALIMLVFSEYSGGRFWLGGKINEDPNYLCGYLFAGIILCLQNILHKNRKTFNLVELILYLFLVLQTGSRGGLIAVAVAVILYVLSYKKATPSEVFKKFFYILLMLVALLIILNFLPEELQARFNLKDAISSGGTGRFEIWTEGIIRYKNFPTLNKLFGVGTGTITEILVLTMYGETKGAAMHNIFLETLVELGAVGFIIYLISIISFTVSAFKEKDKFAFAVICGMVVLSISTSLHTFKPYFNIMLMILVLKNHTMRESKND